MLNSILIKNYQCYKLILIFMRIIDIDQIRLIQPSLATLVSSRYKDKDALLTVGWIMPVSYNPGKVAIAISPERFSHSIIKNSGLFAVNIMEYKYVKSIYCAGTVSGRDVKDKFSYCGLDKIVGKTLPIPIVKEALGVIECKVSNSITTGDHEVFVGDVETAYVKDKYTSHWDVSKCHPVLYVSEGHFITIDNNKIKKYDIK